jgi:cytochrome c-type biogenesis protein CcmH/NrfF
MRFVVALACALGLLVAMGAHAAPAQPVADDEALEARVQALSEQLRCLVCQNQSLADSHASLALDLKNQVREQLRSGSSEAQVVTYMTQRYGDFVLYNPPFKLTTWVLWAGPALLALIGLGLGWRGVSRGRSTPGHPERAPPQEPPVAAADWLNPPRDPQH